MFTDFYRPLTASEAVKMRIETPKSAYLGGGTIINTLTYEKYVPEEEQAQCLISLSDLHLNNIELTDSELIIGSGATIQELLDNPDVFPAIKEAAGLIVNRNIRNIATIGGNIACRASSANAAAMFLAMDASLEIESKDGSRKMISLSDYYASGCTKCLIISVHVPRSAAEYAFAVRRYVRTQNDISILLSYALVKGTAEKIEDIKLVMGGVSALPVHLAEIEEKLKGSALPERDELVSWIKPLIHPITDLRGSKEFKTLVGAEIAAWTVFKALEKL